MGIEPPGTLAQRDRGRGSRRAKGAPSGGTAGPTDPGDLRAHASAYMFKGLGTQRVDYEEPHPLIPLASSKPPITNPRETLFSSPTRIFRFCPNAPGFHPVSRSTIHCFRLPKSISLSLTKINSNYPPKFRGKRTKRIRMAH
jgi:hypothetical protein